MAAGGRGIAFLLQLTNETLPGAERLLRALWHPDNVFLVHIDAKWAADPAADSMREHVARAPYRDNVIMMRPQRLTYAGITLALNTLDGIAELLPLPGRRWSHFTPVSGADYPLLRPAEVQDVLAAASERAGGELSFVEAWVGDGEKRWRRPALDPALWNAAERKLARLEAKWHWIHRSKSCHTARHGWCSPGACARPRSADRG
ncbi:hypothetical protein DFJ74DRAFT_38185 [Hyaloraphidium curvatum]|nr:hypothetical protein DFJ74DRAFT_38185 [Hyaloraphidium curvatum]